MKVWFGCMAACVALTWAAPAARAESGFAGTYRASPQRIEAQVSAWGEDCGTRPQSQVLEEPGKVEVRTLGAQLVLRFADRTVRTDACWSPNPAVKLISTNAVENRFQAECRTASGDAKRELGRYSISASPGKLELLEESEYDWQLKQSHCVAKVRVTQTLTDVRKPAPPPAAEPAPAPSAAEKVPCTPGPVARLRVRPSEARIAPGERVCLTVRALDAAGCAVEPLPASLALNLTKPPGAQGTLTGTCFKAAANAALAEGVFKVVASAEHVRAEASIAVAALDLSDITARRGSSGSSALAPGAARAGETPLESGIRAVTSGSHGSLWLGLSIAGLAGVLSLLAVGTLRVLRRRAPALRAQSSLPPAPAPRRPAPEPARPAPAPVAPASGPQRVCPKCRRGYAPGSARCAADGTDLVDYAEFIRRAQDSDAPPRACPQCGEQLGPGAQFCGLCGQRL